MTQLLTIEPRNAKSYIDTDSTHFFLYKRCIYSKIDVYSCATKKLDVDYLFYLSELAFAVELAVAKAQEEDSVFRIRSAEDAYQVLTDKETLGKVLQQGLKEEHMYYKRKDSGAFHKYEG